ncbi:ubiquitin carboxyl-terminal hydrolase-domain-containing protein [Zopfochytrium polystomum]|nr:ubiquitin carboxyl-terminal hydrolase-domain-containing protein [Zopfochytrium polystomum]
MALSERFHTTTTPPGVPLSAVAFDPLQELVWVGSDTGHISSYTPVHASHTAPVQNASTLRRYTAFRGHDGAVRQILVNEQGVFSVGGSSVRLSHRRGLRQWIYNGDGTPMLAAGFTTLKSELLVSDQNRLSIINLYRGTATRQMDDASNVTFLKLAKYMCCGATNGHIQFRDPRSLRIEHSMDAYSGSLTVLEATGSTMVMCGFGMRGGQQVMEPMLKLYDLRMHKYLPPIPFPTGASALKFNPALPSKLLACSRSGEFQICDLGNPSLVQFYQASIQGFLTAADFSSTGENVIITGSDGSLSVMGEKDEIKFNLFSQEIEMPDAPSIPSISIPVESDVPLSRIGMPYYTSPLLSVWPSTMIFEAGNPAPRIPDEILADVKMIDFVGYAKKPSTIRRNQVLASPSPKKSRDHPRFRSEQERDGGSSLESLTLSPTDEGVPKVYRRVEIKYSRFGVEDFDFGFYNKTHYGGLETHIANSYCNAMLQVLFFNQAIREVVFAHVVSTCSRSACITCELGFLFQMLESSSGANCQATNLLSVFSSIPQAAALGLFEPVVGGGRTGGLSSSTTLSYSTLIQNFHRFILEQINQETTLVEAEDGAANFQKLFAVQIRTLNTCQCKSQETRDTFPFVLDVPRSKNKDQESKFSERLLGSLDREYNSRVWCNNCSRYQPMVQKRSLREAPNVLSVNVQNGEDSSDGDWTAPLHIAIIFEGSKLSVEERIDPFPDGYFSDEADVTRYSLRASVAEIKDDKTPPHLVAHILVPEENEWFLFNDFLVQPISVDEATQNRKWKTISILQYVKDGFSIPPDAFNADKSLTLLMGNPTVNTRNDLLLKYQLLTTEEAEQYKGGFLCAIDSEFVALSQEETELRSNGTKFTIRPSRQALARVSVVRGEPGPLHAVPFIDDYISIQEPIVDYLTEFSGIKAGDLDPHSSRYPLVPLKVAYKKLRLLVDLGCKFVGHGLKKDLRIINIIVPPEQIIDTVDIFFKKERQRKLSLRFLAWSLLRMDVQQDSHDSIEDARTALLLYEKYVELKESGKFDEALDALYEEGRLYNFRPPQTARPIQ